MGSGPEINGIADGAADRLVGDSWIHGAGSDLHKLGQVRAMQRFYDGLEDITPNASPSGGGLAMVAEHTWGVDLKTYLREIPDYAAGVRFNLYNNKWGTNFPMWWEGSVMFRFVVELAR